MVEGLVLEIGDMVEGLVAFVVAIVVVVDAGRWVVGVVVIVGMIVGMAVGYAARVAVVELRVAVVELGVDAIVEHEPIVEPCAVAVKGVRLWWLEVMLCLGDS